MARRTRRRRRRSHTSKSNRLLAPLGVLAAAIAIAGGVAAAWAIDIYESAPPLSSLKPVQKGRSSAIYAADGSLIGFIQSENIRQPVPTRALPQTIKDATVAIDFRLPPGVDFLSGHPIHSRLQAIGGFKITKKQPVFGHKQGIVMPTRPAQGFLHFRPDGLVASFIFFDPVFFNFNTKPIRFIGALLIL